MSELVLLRHGQSVWNSENRFTGWVDVPLSDQGRSEAISAGELLVEADLLPDVVHTSLLRRAIITADLALDQADRLWIPTIRSWRLNERHYGALQGLDKKATTEKYGKEQVFQWRRSYDVAPPLVDLESDDYPGNDIRYADMAPDFPRSECLKDVVGRVVPYFEDVLMSELDDHGVVLVVAHGNSLRALMKHLEGISDDDIADLNVPCGVPKVYCFDDDLQVYDAHYLGDAKLIASLEAEVANQAG